jgi:hypothetical protein
MIYLLINLISHAYIWHKKSLTRGQFKTNRNWKEKSRCAHWKKKKKKTSLIGSPSLSTLLRRSWWHFGVYSWPTHHVSFPCLSHERFVHIKHVRKKKVGLKVRSSSCDRRQQWKLNPLFDVLHHLSYISQCKNRGNGAWHYIQNS